jgi:Kef-type K+ transport system membrane component KefB
VALLGVVIPFGLGYVVSALLLTEQPVTLHLFIGATLVATSVGITARVLKDLDAIHSAEAKLILGAAVIDDVLGLIVLAVVTGIVVTGAVQVGEIVKISLLSAAFFAALIVGGNRYMPRLASAFRHLEARNLTLLFPLIVAFIVAWAANLIGLATIIGAFAAGLIVNEEHFSGADTERGSPLAILAPLEALFAPVFFVLVGMQVNLQSFLDPDTLWLACGFTIAALIGKLAAGWGAKPGVDKLSVGIGMIPRGEVGLIFASIGKGLGVVTDAVFSAVVVMVIVTTLVAPLGLKRSLARHAAAGQS